VAPIRDPGLDREQASKNISPQKRYIKREASRKRSRRNSGWEREKQVVKDQEGGRRVEKRKRLEGTTAGSVERAACPIHKPAAYAPAQI
jgi:hypothetical protein